MSYTCSEPHDTPPETATEYCDERGYPTMDCIQHIPVSLRVAANVFRQAREGILITDTNAKVVDVNAAFCRITGYTRDEIIGKNPKILASGRHTPEFYAQMWDALRREGHWSGELWNRRKNGVVFPELQNISAVFDDRGAVQYYVAVFHDISAIKSYQRHLETIAHQDPLTGLPNRALLLERVTAAMEATLVTERKVGLIYLDLDGFKQVNDSYGHSEGDALLIAVANFLSDAVREEDTVARIGGDEFVVLIPSMAREDMADDLANRILGAVIRAAASRGLFGIVTVSAGVTYYEPDDEIGLEQLMRQADHAMYLAKEAGKNQVRVFDASAARGQRHRQETVARMEAALRDNEFCLFYQPKVNMRTGAVRGAEALIRWQHPEQGLIPPNHFLPLVENHPLSLAIGDWVLRTAIAQIAEWRAQGLTLRVSVNIAANQLQHPNFLHSLKAALAACPSVNPSQLELEIVESYALENLAMAYRVLAACKQVGVSLALDDFGTGYSSLTYLRRLPFDVVKIDQSFVRHMLHNPDDLTVMESVLTLTTGLRRIAIAEGVETEAHGEMLLRMGCEVAQGYGIARPMPAKCIPAWVDTWVPPAAWACVHRVSVEDAPMLFAGAAHQVWETAVEAAVNGSAADPELDPTRCRLGLWLAAEATTGRLDGTRGEAILRLHEAVHQHAAKLLEFRNKGQQDEAVAGIAELHVRRNRLLHALDGYRRHRSKHTHGRRKDCV